MKTITLWAIAAFSGLVFVVILNTTSIAHVGWGLQLPFGWHNAATGAYHVCTVDEDVDPNAVHCNAPCQGIVLRDGLPLRTSRQNKTDSCLSDYNTLATWLNGVVGLALGPLYIYAGNRHWNKKYAK